VARIIRDYRVGVLAAGPGRQEMEAAWDELQALLQDDDLASRCRRAAEEVFSLASGTAAYAALYADILRDAGVKPGHPSQHDPEKPIPQCAA
jgi:hypothetical protein